jgi:hypothetical protein
VSPMESRRRDVTPPHHYNIRTNSKSTVINILKGYGRDQPSPRDMERVENSWSSLGHAEYCFTLTFAQKHLAANDFKFCNGVYWDQENYHPSVDLGLLEPLFWEEFAGEVLILYHPAEKSFWAWCGTPHVKHNRDRLIRWGYKWTDVFLKDPNIHFNSPYGLVESTEFDFE